MLTLQRSFKSAGERVFALDTRSLAISRIFIALIVLGDLLTRSFFLTSHYGNEGVLPQTLFFNKEIFGDWFWSFHLAGPSPLFPTVLFVIHILFALMLLIGWKTRTATFGTWLLTLSLQFANPLLMHGGDILLRIILFLFIFLPIGKQYSVDSAFSDSPSPHKILTPWTTALVLQICFFYFFTFIHKSGSEWTTDGTAVYYALSLEQFTTPIGTWLYSFPLLMMLASFAVWWIQRLSIFLILSPFWTDITRIVAITLLSALHVSFGLALYLGIFSWVSIAALITLLPSRFWEFLKTKIHSHFSGITIYYDENCKFCLYSARLIKTFSLIPNSKVLPAQKVAEIEHDMRQHDSWVVVTPKGDRFFAFEGGLKIVENSPILFPLATVGNIPTVKRFGNVIYRLIANHRKSIPLPRPSKISNPNSFHKICSIFLAILFIYSALFWCLKDTPSLGMSLPLPATVQWTERVLGLNQTWWLFAPFPRKDDGWYIVSGTLTNGSQIDLLQEGLPITYEKPQYPSALYPDARWRKYFINLKFDSATEIRPYLLRYMCNSWNESQPPNAQVTQAELIYMLEESLLNYQHSPIKKLSLATTACPPQITRIHLD